MFRVVGVNVQVGKNLPRPPAGLPVLAVVSDWMQDLEDFRFMNVTLYRFMGNNWRIAPAGSEITIGNEDDQPDQWMRVQARMARAAGYVVHCPAVRPGQPQRLWAAECAVVDQHCAITAAPYPVPGVVTELELTPSSPEWDSVVQWCRFFGVNRDIYVWGADQQLADINLHQDIIRELEQLNATLTEVPAMPVTVTTQGLNIGPGMQKWIDDHQATPLEGEEFWSENGHLVRSELVVLVGAADGVTQVPVRLEYIAATNEVYEFNFPEPYRG